MAGARITVPTLLLWGDADPIGTHLASLLPHARVVVIPGGDRAFARNGADEVAAHVACRLGVGA